MLSSYASALAWNETRARIEQAELFWITTVRPDGRLHITPLVAVWHAGALHFCTGGEEQKALNLAANPNVALTTGSNEWNAGVDVVHVYAVRPVRAFAFGKSPSSQTTYRFD